MSSTPPCCPPGSWPQSVLQTREELNKDARKFEPAGTVVPLPSAGGAPVAAYVVKSAGKAPSLLVLQDIYSSRVLHPSSRSGDRLVAVCDALWPSPGTTQFACRACSETSPFTWLRRDLTMVCLKSSIASHKMEALTGSRNRAIRIIC